MFGLNLEDFLFVRESVSFSKKNQSFLVLSSDRKNIIELKDVAFVIWENLEKTTSFTDLLKKVKVEYDVPEEELKKDLKDWLKEAIDEKIVRKLKNS
jgi:hypothetical protein